eukprot:767614-Hanusia_phi.AAC.4
MEESKIREIALLDVSDAVLASLLSRHTSSGIRLNQHLTGAFVSPPPPSSSLLPHPFTSPYPAHLACMKVNPPQNLNIMISRTKRVHSKAGCRVMRTVRENVDATGGRRRQRRGRGQIEQTSMQRGTAEAKLWKNRRQRPRGIAAGHDQTVADVEKKDFAKLYEQKLLEIAGPKDHDIQLVFPTCGAVQD